jgi:glycogen operon protein
VRRTQNGNNNAYCQDNEISWFNWDDVRNNASMQDFVQKLIALRTRHPVFQRNRFFGGSTTSINNNPPDISWFNFDGTVPDWKKMNRFLSLRLGGKAAGIKRDEMPFEDNDFYIAFNMDIHDMTVTIPKPSMIDAKTSRKWYRLIDTSMEHINCALFDGQEESLNSQEHYVVLANSIVVLIAK